jgi:ABC-type transport system involved in multi-copper enzyme maturation permease subunit
MSLSGRRIRAIVLKELREYRRNRTIFVGMAVFPLVFTMQPLVVVFKLPASASGSLAHEHVLLYMLGIPILAPIFVAAYGVVGERLQGTLEPALTTPIRREELLLGKALAGLAPSLALAYGVFGLFLVIVALFAQPGIAQGLVQ